MISLHRGFTLIELLIAIAILGIIVSIAYPSYQDFVLKTRRTEAQSELIKAQVEQSSYRITEPNYSSDINIIGLPTAHEHYTFSIVSASTHTYLLKAQVKESSVQKHDEVICQSLYINQSGLKTSDGEKQNTACW
ncbi:pilus assembly protein [Psychromonas sp. B3M02]|uniref:type IV pilin protein n=1 Tax=unclassified Psychromonas TaxID=2614957 RepID=UPI000DE8E088|nr:type IV pilin protein [Psychromonas sp. B3M02]RBW47852.1 pilus assembly protein [Psychromonas sp. B3M02]